MPRGITSVPLQKLFTLAPQHVPTRGHSVILGNWLSLIVALMQDVSSSLFESSTDRTAYHKKQLMPAQSTCSRTSWTGFGTAGWVSLWTHGPRVTPWLYNARTVMSHSTGQRQQQQMLIPFQLVHPYQVSYQVSYFTYLLYESTAGITLPRRCVGRQTTRNNVEADIGDNTATYYRRSVFIPFLEDLISQLHKRFEGLSSHALQALLLLPPNLSRLCGEGSVTSTGSLRKLSRNPRKVAKFWFSFGVKKLEGFSFRGLCPPHP